MMTRGGLNLSAGQIALLLHYADDEDHARRAYEHMAKWLLPEGWGLLDDAKRACEETRDDDPR